jgi:hypothetical protein
VSKPQDKIEKREEKSQKQDQGQIDEIFVFDFIHRFLNGGNQILQNQTQYAASIP